MDQGRGTTGDERAGQEQASASPPAGLTDAVAPLVRGAIEPLRLTVAWLTGLPVIGGGVAAAGEALAGLGRGDVSSFAEARRTFADAASARMAFARCASELIRPNAWRALSGWENAAFCHYSRAGRYLPGRQEARVGDFIRITLPIAGAERHDWVEIEHVAREADRLAIAVRPSHDPTRRPPRPDVIAHFFGPDARNVFSLRREGATVIAQIAGAHERANAGAEAGGPDAALRHRLTAETGWGLRLPSAPPGTLTDGPQQHQWNRFVTNLLAIGHAP